MSNKSPIFPMPEPKHFSDYGFDPHIDYVQFLEEARKHQREASCRSIDSLHFKLQKPIPKEDSGKKIRKSSKKKRWWKNALLFFKWKWVHSHSSHANLDDDAGGVHQARARAFRASISGPVYVIDSASGSSTPYRTTSRRPSSGPLAGTVTPARKGELEIPYLNLREQQQGISTSSVPIYLVT